MKYIAISALLLAGLFFAADAHSVRKMSDAEVQLLMEITGPTWGLHTMCLTTQSNTSCTDAYECSTPPEWVEIYKTSRGQKYQVFTDCIDWSLECPYDGVRNEPGQTCRWNIDNGYIQIWLKQNGFVIEEVY